jgi:hypothetical protein
LSSSLDSHGDDDRREHIIGINNRLVVVVRSRPKGTRSFLLCVAVNDVGDEDEKSLRCSIAVHEFVINASIDNLSANFLSLRVLFNLSEAAFVAPSGKSFVLFSRTCHSPPFVFQAATWRKEGKKRDEQTPKTPFSPAKDSPMKLESHHKLN